MPFEKGKSGNAKGAPRRQNTAALKARKYAEEAIDTLVALMRSDKEDIRHKGAIALLDRGFGKPTEFVELTGEDGGAIKTTSIPATDIWLATLLRSGKDAPSAESKPH